MKVADSIFVNFMRIGLSAALTFGVVACGSGFSAKSSLLSVTKDSYGGGSGKVSLSWTANRETLVNTTGGGYRVYYAQYSSVTASTPFIDVPYVSGSQSPTSINLTGLISGTYYVHVKAYSAVNSDGSDFSSASQFTVQ